MVSYRIEWKASAKKELKRLDQSVIPRIVDAVGHLVENPYPEGCRMLKGSKDTFRIRVGDYRVVYEVIGTRLVVLIIRLRHRRDVYR